MPIVGEEDRVYEECAENINLEGLYQITCQGYRSIKVLADAHKIEQVVVNLLNNAIKYAPNSKNIEIIWVKQDDRIRVAVMDYGKGIPSEKLRHLFDRYYQVTENRNSSGLGLELYICEIIKHHGGLIGVESVSIKGVHFGSL